MDMPATTYQWLTSPVMLHSSRKMSRCKLTPEQCAFKQQTWVNWYMADLVYGRASVYFFVATIGVFALAHVLTLAGLRRRQALGSQPLWQRTVACVRLLSYQTIRLRVGSLLDWSLASAGVGLLGLVGAAFFLSITLGPKPYYWPNTAKVSFGDSPPIATRAGYLALGCMPFIFTFAAKANLVAAVTGVSHEKLIAFHKLAAWAMFVLALVHTFPFVVHFQQTGEIAAQWSASAQWPTGVVALAAQAWLTFMSVPTIRHRFYEFFKAMHFLAAAAFVGFLFIHCDFTLTSWDYFIATGALYLSTLLFALARTHFRYGVLQAHLTLDADQTLRVSIPVTAAVHWRPSQHFYLRFLALGVHVFAAHPFTACSVPAAAAGGAAAKAEKRTAVTGVATATTGSELVFCIKPRGGLTGRLAVLARARPGTVVPVYIDGPYGGLPRRWQSADGFDTTLVVAGGAGVGFSLAVVEDWMRKTAEVQHDGGRRELTVVVSTRDPGMRSWFVPALQAAMARYKLDHVDAAVSNVSADTAASAASAASAAPEASPLRIRVAVHETGPAAAAPTSTLTPSLPSSPFRAVGRESFGGSSEKGDGKNSEEVLHVSHTLPPTSSLSLSPELLTIAYHHGRADLQETVHRLAATRGATVGISVCGPSSMLADVATACAAEQRRIVSGSPGAAEVWLHREAFSD